MKPKTDKIYFWSSDSFFFDGFLQHASLHPGRPDAVGCEPTASLFAEGGPAVEAGTSCPRRWHWRKPESSTMFRGYAMTDPWCCYINANKNWVYWWILMGSMLAYIPYGSKYLLRKCLGYNLLSFGELSTFSDSVWIHRDRLYSIVYWWNLMDIDGFHGTPYIDML